MEFEKFPVVSTKVFDQLASGALDFGLAQLRLGRADDGARDLVLQLENVVQRAVEAVCPKMRARTPHRLVAR